MSGKWRGRINYTPEMHARDRLIVADYRLGGTLKSVGRLYDLDPSRIAQILKRLAPEIVRLRGGRAGWRPRG